MLKLKQEKQDAPQTPLLTDLRPISRDVKRCVTTVDVEMLSWDRSSVSKWLILGASSLVKASDRRPGEWSLQARMDDATDFEHDSAYLFRLPLLGLQFDDLAVYNHFTNLIAWVNPNELEDFRVPGPGYDPRKHKDAYICKEPQCLKDDKGKRIKGHTIVPFFVPPLNPELFELVKGKRVEIRIGPVFENKDENEE